MTGSPFTSIVDLDFETIEAPLPPPIAWEMEQFLVKIFEYGNYSFRNAFSGVYSGTLNVTLCLVRHQERLIGVAVCLYGKMNSSVAIIGPTGVYPNYRRRGIGTQLVQSLLGHLESTKCKVAYLGVTPQGDLRDFYTKLGFKRHSGVVMRYLFCPEQQIDNDLCHASDEIAIRKVEWGDFASVSSFMVMPESMYTYNYEQGLFSTRYVPLSRFLPVFPEMMQTIERGQGLAYVLTCATLQNILGLAQVRYYQDEIRAHSGSLDFFIQDQSLDHAQALLRTTLRQCSGRGLQQVMMYSLSCDFLKQEIIQELNAKQVAILPDQVMLRGQHHDVFVYRRQIHTQRVD